MGRATVLALLLTGCNRYGLTPLFDGSVAVTAGDFDQVTAPFDRLEVATTSYEGIISTATWDPQYEPDNVALKVEDLFLTDLTEHQLVVVASGTRGFGERVYNGLDPDDALVSNDDVIARTRAFVARGGTLVVTDWAYDLVEAAWPDQMAFSGDDGTLDAAQIGVIGTVTADVVEPRLARALDMDEMAVRFDYGDWAVADSAVDDAIVWIEADGEPLLVTLFPEGPAGGQVIFAAFHFDAQTDAVMDTIVETAIGRFER